MTTNTLDRPSVIEYIQSLTSEEKDTALVELIRCAIRQTGGEELLPVLTKEGESLGFYVPPLIANKHLEAVWPKLSEEDRERSRRARENLNRTFNMDQFLNELSREDRE